MIIDTYHARLAVMDHSKGTSNQMIKEAMKAEIMELRKALRAANKAQERALAAQQRVHQTELKNLKRNLANNKALVTEWRGHATRYQKQLVAQKAKENT